MGNCISTPSSPSCFNKCPFWPYPFHCHFRSPCKRIKRTLTSHHASKATATAVDNNDDKNNTAPTTAQLTGGESPPSLHRSNAIRRAFPASGSVSRSRSRSRSSSPQLFTPTRLRVRNTTPSPTRPTSIVPTLMLHNTPSTNQTSLSRSTAPTSPSATTFISSVHHLGHERPTTLYVVDGVAIDSEAEGSPPYELRCVDAYRRVVVDVVEMRRSGRLTVVNGDGRASLETLESRRGDGEGIVNGRAVPPPPPPPPPQQQHRQPEMVQVAPKAQRTLGIDGFPNPPKRGSPEMVQLAPTSGTPTKRALLEDTMEKNNKKEPRSWNNTRLKSIHETTPIFTPSIFEPSTPSPLPFIPTSTPFRRRPLPLPPPETSPSSPPSSFLNIPPIRRKPVPLLPRTTAAVAAPPRFSTSPQHQVYYQRRKRPMARPPIPTFPVRATERELLAEVEGVRRMLDGRERKEEEEKMAVVKEWDWFWVDDEEGGMRYRRGGLVVDVDLDV
ncbi:MAG: hypothetical protein Q9184_006822 [Pyrenodesmia sp. 2 TL-2023]